MIHEEHMFSGLDLYDTDPAQHRQDKSQIIYSENIQVNFSM